MKNLLVYFSENLCYRPIWYRRSPPLIKSIMRYKWLLSWKAKFMLIMKSCRILLNRLLSFMTELMLLLVITFDLHIYFNAKCWPLSINYTFQTFPKPPLPITWQNLNESLDISLLGYIWCKFNLFEVKF